MPTFTACPLVGTLKCKIIVGLPGLDLLTGRTDVELDFKNIQRIIDIQNMGPRHQDTMYYVIDALIRNDKHCKIQGLTELQ